MLKDLLLQCRSYRSFDSSVEVTEEQLREFVDCARLTPSSINLQMLKYRLVFKPEECDILLQNTRWAAKLKDIQLPPSGHAPRAYIVICADQNVIPSAEGFQKDVGICAQTIMLAATESGLGGCILASFSKEALEEQLHLPKGLVPQLVLALGKPDESVVITSPAADGSVTYYRENETHYVQKRTLEELIIRE